MGYAALIPLATSMLSMASQSSNPAGAAGSPLGAPQQGANGAWNFGAPATDPNAQPGSQNIRLQDFINPGGSKNSYMQLLDPIGHQFGGPINSLIDSIFK